MKQDKTVKKKDILKEYVQNLNNPISSSKEKLDKKTLTPEELAIKHKVSLSDIMLQLEAGIDVESEHTTDPALAREIALDHIKENPKYYDILGENGL